MQHSGLSLPDCNQVFSNWQTLHLKQSFILIRAEGKTITAFGFLFRTLPPPLSRITLGSKGKDIEKFHIYKKMQTPKAEKAQKLQAFSALAEDWVWFHKPVIPAPGGSNAFGLYRHLYQCAHTHTVTDTYTNITENKSMSLTTYQLCNAEEIAACDPSTKQPKPLSCRGWVVKSA